MKASVKTLWLISITINLEMHAFIRTAYRD